LKICLTIPVRGTPENVERMYDNLEDTGYKGDVLWGLDEDDPDLEKLISVIPEGDYVIGPRLRFCGTLNAMAEKVWDKYDVITMGGSDHAPRTESFDDMVAESLEKNLMCFGSDGIQGAGLATFCFARTDLIKEVGYFVTPEAKHLYVDNMLMDLGNGLNALEYLPNMFIEHLHPVAGKTEWTDLYRLNNSQETYSEDHQAYLRWQEGLPALLQRLKAAGYQR